MKQIVFWDNRDTIGKAALFTPWSLIHFINGVLCYNLVHNFTDIGLRYNLSIGLIVHTWHEIEDLVESIKIRKIHKDANGNNSVENCIFDTIAFLMGQIFGYYFNHCLPTAPLILVWFIVYKMFTKMKIG
jgi:hypothetical protein